MLTKDICNLIILNKRKKIKNRLCILCQCSVCKIKKYVRQDQLDSGNQKSIRCKCGIKTRTRRGYGEASFRNLYQKYGCGAKSRNIKFDLSEDDFRKFTKQNCFYCNKTPSQIGRYKDCNGGYIYNGIDRVNNDLGYTMENSVTCCKYCNYMKRELTVEQFFNHIENILNKWKTK